MICPNCENVFDYVGQRPSYYDLSEEGEKLTNCNKCDESIYVSKSDKEVSKQTTLKQGESFEEKGIETFLDAICFDYDYYEHRGKVNKLDFDVYAGNILKKRVAIVEIKTRSITLNTFNTALIRKDKVDVVNELDADCPVYYVLRYEDGWVYIRLDNTDFTQYRTKRTTHKNRSKRRKKYKVPIIDMNILPEIDVSVNEKFRKNFGTNGKWEFTKGDIKSGQDKYVLK